MVSVTVDEIQRDASKYLRQVEAGETVIIVQADKAISELRPISSSEYQLGKLLCRSIPQRICPNSAIFIKFPVLHLMKVV
jgi:antitoxin (DNA-binding transcriptional repressor) of toxin-antitoxin stability system